LIRHYCFIEPQSDVSLNGSWLYQYILSFFPSLVLQNIFAVIVLWVQSILINTMVSTHKLGRETTLFAGLFYVLFFSLSKESLALSPILLSNLFLILGIYNIVELTKHVDIRHHLFNSGLFITISALIYPPYLLIVILGVIGFHTMKSLKSYGNIQYLTGVLSALILIFGFQYVTNGVLEHSFYFQLIKFDFLKNVIPLPLKILISLYVLFIIIVLFQYSDLMSKKSIQTRKKIELFYLLLVFFGFSAIIFYKNDPTDIYTIALPLGVLFGIRLSELKSITISEIVHLFLLICLIFIQYNVISF
jgi:hypothetical protein